MTPFIIAAMCVLGADHIPFERQKIADTPYEAASAFDVNRDGHLDIVSGEYWFPGPQFADRHKISDLPPINGYHDDFGDYPMDVDGDGYLDIISGGWFGQTLSWRRNPEGKTTPWTVTDIDKVGNIEKPCFWDIDGDGTIEVVPNTPNNPQSIFQLIRDPNGKTIEFRKHTISDAKNSGHGLGFGDINGDGRGDLILHNGWLEAPEKPFDAKWAWHADFKLFDGASVPVLVHDVNNDGLADLICGAGHDYGLAWWEQGKDANGKSTWTKHDIETQFSQFHDMALADLDNDGKLELITGKRRHAHNGKDPGGNEPVGLYIYHINNGQFAKQTLNYGPAESNSGTGIYLWIEDLNKDGKKDIVAPGKEGLYVFYNRG